MNEHQTTRVALLHRSHQHHRKVAEVLALLANETIDIELRHDLQDLPETIASCDLILFEASGQLSADEQTALNWIRLGSLAPVVMLTNGQRPERAIDGILAGADAVIPLTTAHNVIVAHCRALVRRWRAQPNRAQRLA